MTDCFHCGLAVPPGSDFQLTLEGQCRDFCCPGCQAVAEAIVDGGLSSFYQFRSQINQRPDLNDSRDDKYTPFDLPEVQQDFVRDIEGGQQQAQLILEGITCAACVWLIEHHLQKIEGVVDVKVNANTHRCLVTWTPEKMPLSQLMHELARIGYAPQPASEDRQHQLQQQEQRQILMRLAVAGLGMMQVGMFATALYAGALQGISESWESFFRWISFAVATPVVFYSARSFFQGAKRALMMRHLTMDVPVALAIGGAYAASAWATINGGGEVYFDSVSMFTFFLLWGRYLEMRARHRNSLATGRLAQLLPLTADRWHQDSHSFVSVPVKSLQPGDKVLICAGGTVPCDGRVVEGRSGIVEALLTGEPDAIQKTVGDQVTAGTLNTDAPLQIEVEAVGAQTRLSAIEYLVEQAQQEKPQQVAMADKLAGYFVGAVLVVSAIVFTSWYFIEPDRALWITLSVLVVTCPCALSLASPAALTAAVAELRDNGLLITRGHVLESLSSITHVIFDKTGTLTVGEPQVSDVILLNSDITRDQVLAMAAALEAGSSHPLAKAFTPWAGQAFGRHITQQTGHGVEGDIDEQHYRLGRVDFAAAHLSEAPLEPKAASGQWLLLCGEREPLAWIALQDTLRASAADAVKRLQQRGLQIELLSGDSSAVGQQLASHLGLDACRTGVTAKQKLEHVHALQESGERVLMVGDGINDIPVLSGADISVAMGGATDLAQTRADSILLSSDLHALDKAFDCAVLTRRIIRQNLSWALAYNGLALPLAALGLIPPYLAAIGMSLSSLVVVTNALRIHKS
jgi:P-type Cu2+ transporter